MMQVEIEFRNRLANMLRGHPHYHTVYFHEGDDRAKFSMSNAKGYPDLYIRTNPLWASHNLFPIIAVETKLSKDLKWTGRQAVTQINKYHNDTIARYYIDDVEVPRPSLILLASEDSVFGHAFCLDRLEPELRHVLYVWHNPKYKTHEQLWAAADALTEYVQRELQDTGAAILLGTRFQSNIVDATGGKGPMRWHELWSDYMP